MTELNFILREGDELPYEGDLRSANVDPLVFVVVTPAGYFHKSPIATNIDDGIVMIDGKKPYVRPAAREQGYMTLKDVADDEEQLAGLYSYFDWEIARKGKVKPMPKELLPKKVQELRDKSAQAPQYEYKPKAGTKRGAKS